MTTREQNLQRINRIETLSFEEDNWCDHPAALKSHIQTARACIRGRRLDNDELLYNLGAINFIAECAMGGKNGRLVMDYVEEIRLSLV